MPATPKTACVGHRTMGYALTNGVWACRVCGQPAEVHETTDETVARRKAVEDAEREAARWARYES